MTTDTAVRTAITVAVPPERAFSTFTAGFDGWWPRSHHIGQGEMAEAVIEPREGGRWYERGVDGSECDWGKVIVWDPPTRIVLGWQLSSEWAYDPDVWTELEITSSADGPDRTRSSSSTGGSTPTASRWRRCGAASARTAGGAGYSSDSERRRLPAELRR